MKKDKSLKQFTQELETDLSRNYGHLLTGEVLQTLLGFKSEAAFLQALYRDKDINSMPVFVLEKRRGKFALTKDVAVWLATQRFNALN